MTNPNTSADDSSATGGHFEPLSGLRVFDLTEGVAGPFACQLLGDLGAEIIKVERPDGDWLRGAAREGSARGGTHFKALNRNKRNICLDLRSTEGVQIAWRLLERCDVMISSFRLGAVERLGFGYDEVSCRFPSLAYVRVSAFGTKGAMASMPGSDTVIQAMSGLMSQIGEPDEPPHRVQVPVTDVLAARDAVISILAALLVRDRTGQVPGPIDISLFASASTFQASIWQEYFETGVVQKRAGRKHASLPPSGMYRAACSGYVVIAILRDEHFVRLCNALGIAELPADERFRTNAARVEHRASLEERVASIIASRPTVEWRQVFREFDVLAASINELNDIADDPELRVCLPVVDVPAGNLGEATQGIGFPVSFGDTLSPPTPPALRGEHTDEIMAELGYEPEQVERLRRDGVIRRAAFE